MNEKIELELNTSYNQAMLAKALGITAKTLRNNKDKQLNNLSLYYEFKECVNGRIINYIFTKKLGDYQPPRKTKTNHVDKVIDDYILKKVKKDRKQTAANITRIAFADNKDNSIKNLGYTHKYTYQKVRLRYGIGFVSEQKYGMIDHWALCRLDEETNTYIELSLEQQDYLNDLTQQELNTTREYAKLIGQTQDSEFEPKKEIQRKKEMEKLAYAKAKDKFTKKYGYRPMQVPVLLLKEEDYIDFK